jgi:hypothetical protein
LTYHTPASRPALTPSVLSTIASSDELAAHDARSPSGSVTVSATFIRPDSVIRCGATDVITGGPPSAVRTTSSPSPPS